MAALLYKRDPTFVSPFLHFHWNEFQLFGGLFLRATTCVAGAHVDHFDCDSPLKSVSFVKYKCMPWFTMLLIEHSSESSEQSTARMSYHNNNAMGSGSRGGRRTVEFGRTYVVRPKGRHQATFVWLHGLGDNCSSWSQLLESLPLPNVKWICPTAPTRPVKLLGGFSCNAWFDAGELSEDGPEDMEGLDASAMHVVNLLSSEPADVKLGIGGFSMGASIALYSAVCWSVGKFGNGIPYPVNLRAVIGLSGWLPCSRSPRNKIEASNEGTRRAASLPVLLCHGTCDEMVPYNYGEKSARHFGSAGFRQVTFKSYEGIGHYTVPREMGDVCYWIASRMGLEG